MQNDLYLRRLKEVECPDATYPAVDPALVMHRGSGSMVYDVEGRPYIDLCAGFGALSLGHNPKAHQQVLMSRVSSTQGNGGEAEDSYIPPYITHGMGDVYASSAKVDLLNYLSEILPPSLSTAALALTGAQAVEIACKTAMLATSRSRFVVFDSSYHGLDLGILPLTERADFRAPFRGFLREDKVVSLAFHCSEDALSKVLARGEIAGVIVEPVQGRAGCRPATDPWLAMLRRQCDEHQTLLIYDEVFTGIGRTGQITFAERVPCDLLCLGKGFGGGFPISVCVGTAEAMGSWPANRGEAIHTGTFFGHPLSCAIALATLQEIITTNLVQRANQLGERLLSRLRLELGRHPRVKEVRGLGLMIAVELSRNGDGARLMDLLRSRGVIALASGTRGECLSLTPALNIPESLIEKAVDELHLTLNLLESH